MKLFFHYCPIGFSNCYVLGTEPPVKNEEQAPPLPGEKPGPPEKKRQSKKQPAHEAIVIDPGNMDADLLDLIEGNNYKLRAVLITHDHPHHVQGLKTILRIYDTEIFAVNPAIGGYRTTLVKDGQTVTIGSFRTEVISVPGHSADSAVYKIGRLLFTGDALYAGLVGPTASSYAAATQIAALQSKILSLPGDYTVLPGHGPPSSLEAERRFNLGLKNFELQKTRRPAFRIEL